MGKANRTLPALLASLLVVSAVGCGAQTSGRSQQGDKISASAVTAIGEIPDSQRSKPDAPEELSYDLREQLLDDDYNLCQAFKRPHVEYLVGAAVAEPTSKNVHSAELGGRVPVKRHSYRCVYPYPPGQKPTGNYSDDAAILSVQAYSGNIEDTSEAYTKIAYRRTQFGPAAQQLRATARGYLTLSEIERKDLQIRSLHWVCGNIRVNFTYYPTAGDHNEHRNDYAWYILAPVIRSVCGGVNDWYPFFEKPKGAEK